MATAQINLKSEVLNKSTSITIALPENEILNSKKLSILYLLHGLGDDDTKWLRRTTIERLVKRVPIIVVMPDCDKSFYTNMEKGDDYWYYLTKELFEFVENLFNVSQTKENTYIAGNSMGGFGTLKYIVNYPNRFKAAYAFSATTNLYDFFCNENKEKYKQLDPMVNENLKNKIFQATFGDLNLISKSENDIFFRINKLLDSNLLPKISVYCGNEDPLLDMNKEFIRTLQTSNVDHTFVEIDGGHDWNVWQKAIEKTINDIIFNQ